MNNPLLAAWKPIIPHIQETSFDPSRAAAITTEQAAQEPGVTIGVVSGGGDELIISQVLNNRYPITIRSLVGATIVRWLFFCV